MRVLKMLDNDCLCAWFFFLLFFLLPFFVCFCFVFCFNPAKMGFLQGLKMLDITT